MQPCRLLTAVALLLPTIGVALSETRRAHLNASCCARDLYKPCCGGQRSVRDIGPTTELFNATPTMLRRLFAGRTTVLVGDSVTRQWFEQLGCFVGAGGWQWTNDSHAHEAFQALRARATRFGAQLENVNSGISGTSAGYGYWHAPAPINSTSQSGLVWYLSIRKKDLPLAPLVKFAAAPGRDGGLNADTVVVAVGLHWWLPFATNFSDAMCKVMEACTSVPLCIIVDSTPQHFPIPDGTHYSVDWRNWTRQELKGADCNPIVDHEGARWRARAVEAAVEAAPQNTNVVVMRLFDLLEPLWAWHSSFDARSKKSERTPDCTHWCGDLIVWGRWHAALAESLHVGYNGTHHHERPRPAAA